MASQHAVDQAKGGLEKVVETRSDERVPTHVGVPLGSTGIPAGDYWGALAGYTVLWVLLGLIVYMTADAGKAWRDLRPALFGFLAGLVLSLAELAVSVNASVILGMEGKAVDFFPAHARKVAKATRGPFEALARRADVIATTCFNVAACVITWAVYITTSAIGGGARQLQWNLLAFTVALLAGGTATATGNVPAFERSLFVRQRALIFAISLAVAAVLHTS